MRQSFVFVEKAARYNALDVDVNGMNGAPVLDGDSKRFRPLLF
jgi:hypothetical protein